MLRRAQSAHRSKAFSGRAPESTKVSWNNYRRRKGSRGEGEGDAAPHFPLRGSEVTMRDNEKEEPGEDLSEQPREKAFVARKRGGEPGT